MIDPIWTSNFTLYTLGFGGFGENVGFWYG